ncbi:hypothetical protein CHS0354_015080 [Potamilus streckersoni]|uniref:WD repeat-containing protein 37 n=1 Tax=Potamilus streckersoni TaxID=2493646 RepID=A0AAE0WDT2_9BIVA|nr:hypothetical protein CHS0354_015080 [Potamilus streckersoni]
MPTDNINKAASSKTKAILTSRRGREHGSMSTSVNRYDSDTDGQLPYPVRSRLNELFSQIEKEFETIYLENQSLQEKVEALQERLDSYSGVLEKHGGETQDTVDVGPSVKQPKRSSQLSQKIKTTYKASTSKIVSSFRQASPAYSVVREFTGHRDGVWEVSIARTNQSYIGTASADHSARLWDIESGQCTLQYCGHQGSVNAIRFHPSQELVLTASGDGMAHIWRAQINAPSHDTVKLHHSSGEDEIDGSEKEEAVEEQTDSKVTEISTLRTPNRELGGHMGVVIAADWMAGGSQVITASWDRTAILFDTESGDQVSMLSGHDLELTDVRAHSSQKLVVTSSKDTTFRLWDFRDPNMPVSVFQGHTQPVTTARFARQDKVVSGSDDRTVKVWDLKNMRSPIATIRLDSAINRLSVSPNQNIIAIPHDNRHIRLYDINGNRIGRLPRSNRLGHGKMVCSVDWAEENTLCNLFSCSFDRQVLGWHINLQTKE